MWLLAEVKLEDVFQSTHESMREGPGSDRLLILLAGAVALILLLIVLQYRRRRQAMPSALNHHGKLLKELAKPLQLKAPELRRLKQMADEQGLCSPLVLLLCPSLLARSMQDRSAEDRKLVAALVKRMGKKAE
jgi:hypothetical protein